MKKKMFLFFAILVLLLGGIGVSAYTYNDSTISLKHKEYQTYVLSGSETATFNQSDVDKKNDNLVVKFYIGASEKNTSSSSSQNFYYDIHSVYFNDILKSGRWWTEEINRSDGKIGVARVFQCVDLACGPIQKQSIYKITMYANPLVGGISSRCTVQHGYGNKISTEVFITGSRSTQLSG